MATIPAAVVDEELAQPSLLSSAPGVSEIDRSKGGGPREREEAAREDEASLPEPPPPPPPPPAPPKVMSSFFNSSSLSSWSSEEPFKEPVFFVTHDQGNQLMPFMILNYPLTLWVAFINRVYSILLCRKQQRPG